MQLDPYMYLLFGGEVGEVKQYLFSSNAHDKITFKPRNFKSSVTVKLKIILCKYGANQIVSTRVLQLL